MNRKEMLRIIAFSAVVASISTLSFANGSLPSYNTYAPCKTSYDCEQDNFYFLTVKGGGAAVFNDNWHGTINGLAIYQPSDISRNNWMGGISLGYKFANTPFQLGLSYYYIPKFTYTWNATNAANLNANAKMEIYSQTLVFTGIWNFYTDTPFTPYIGLNLGGDVNNAKYFWNDNNGRQLASGSTSRTGIALGALIGLNYVFNQNWVLNFEFNYINLSKPPEIWGLTNLNPVTSESIASVDRLHACLLSAGITYRI